jgi:hypothetical protein
MHQANILRIVVATPSDVQPECNALAEVVDELNRENAGEPGLRLELYSTRPSIKLLSSALWTLSIRRQ